MYWEFEKIWENKYSYLNSHLDYEVEFNYDWESWVEVYFDNKQKLIEDTFYMDFEEYFKNKTNLLEIVNYWWENIIIWWDNINNITDEKITKEMYSLAEKLSNLLLLIK